MQIRRRWLGALLAALAVLAPCPARAETRARAIVLPVENKGFLPNPEMWKARFRESLASALRELRWMVLPADGVDFAPNCSTLPCLSAVANAQHVELVLGLRIVDNEQKEAGYILEMWAFEAQAPDKLVGRTLGCSPCTENQLDGMLGKLFAEVVANLPTTQGPAPKIAPPPPPDAGLPPPRYRRLYQGLAIGSLVVAVAGIVLGAVEVSRDGRACTVPAGSLDCPQYRDTSTGQAIGFTFGFGALAGAGVWAYYGWRPVRSNLAAAP